MGTVWAALGLDSWFEPLQAQIRTSYSGVCAHAMSVSGLHAPN